MENIDPNAEIKTRIKSIYGIYKELYLNKEEPDLHDLFSAKIVLDNNVNCYQALGLIHSIYPPQRGLFKDYIASPKPNGYSALHTTLYVEGGTLLQTQICTKDRNYKNQHGITTNIEQHKNDDKEYMKEELRKWYSFYRNLESIVAEFQGNDDNKAFMKEIKKRVLAEMVYVRQQNGEIIELPKGTNKREFATLIGAPTTDDILVNGRGVTDEHRFKNFETVLLLPTASLYNLRQNPSTNQEEVLNLSLSQSKYKSF